MSVLQRYNDICKVLLASNLNTYTTIVRLTEAAVDLIGADFGAYFKNVGVDGVEEWALHAMHGAAKEEFEILGKPRITQLFRPTYEGQGVVRSNDIVADARSGSMGGLPLGHLPVRSYLAVPVIRRNGEVQGALLFAHRDSHQFSEETEVLVTNLAHLAAIALDNAARFEALESEVEDRKRAERRFRNLIEFAPRMKWYSDESAYFYNAAWHAWTGIPEEIACESIWDETIHKDDREIAMARRREGIATGTAYELEVRFRNAADEYRYLSIIVSPIEEDGRVTGWVGTATDVHDLRMTQSKADEARHLLRSVIDATEDLFFVKDRDGRFVVVNTAVDEVCGGKAEGKTDYDFFPVEVCDSVRDNDRIVMSTGESIIAEETILVEGEWITYQSSKMPWLDDNGDVVGIVGISRNIMDLKRSQETERLLLDELNHRVKNTLATIQSLAVQTLKSTPDPVEFGPNFLGRLQGIAVTHNLLTDSSWKEASLRDVITAELSPYHLKESGRWTLKGPKVTLNSTAVTSIGMIIHELVTNAVKYGALSDCAGCLEVCWLIEPDEEGSPYLILTWVERDGPEVVPPKRSGFGTRLLKSIANQFGGSASQSYLKTGLVCTFAAPMEEVSSARVSAFLKLKR